MSLRDKFFVGQNVRVGVEVVGVDETVAEFSVEEHVTCGHADGGGEFFLESVSGGEAAGSVLRNELEELDSVGGEMAGVGGSDGDEDAVALLAKFKVLVVLDLVHFSKVVGDLLVLMGVGEAIADGEVENVRFVAHSAADVGAG